MCITIFAPALRNTVDTMSVNCEKPFSHSLRDIDFRCRLKLSSLLALEVEKALSILYRRSSLLCDLHRAKLSHNLKQEDLRNQFLYRNDIRGT